MLVGIGEVSVGMPAASGVMPDQMASIGKTNQGGCAIELDEDDVTEHFEEGKDAPEVCRRVERICKLSFSLADADAGMLAEHVGGSVCTADGSKRWGYDGYRLVVNRSLMLVTDAGLRLEIPNGELVATINWELSVGGISVVDFVVTPLAVMSGEAFRSNC